MSAWHGACIVHAWVHGAWPRTVGTRVGRGLLGSHLEDRNAERNINFSSFSKLGAKPSVASVQV